MLGIARLGDSMISVIPCRCHASPFYFVGTIIIGSPNVLTNNLMTARMGDIAASTCGHNIILITMSSKSFANGIGVHRMSDSGVNCSGTAMTLTSSTNVLSV